MSDIRTVYVSGYTDGKSEGIYKYEFDSNTGQLSQCRLAAEPCKHPSYFALDPTKQRLYAVNEVVEYEGENTGYVSAYERRENGSLSLIGQQPSGGEHPCYAVLDRKSQWLLVANYTGGNVASMPLEPTLGKPRVSRHDKKETGAVSARQEKPHAHSIDFHPSDDTWAFSMDLGCDVAVTYRLDNQTGTLTPNSTFAFPDGTGPRHLVFSPIDSSVAYVVGELSNMIFGLKFSNGEFTEIQRIDGLPQDFEGENLASEIDITPNGKFLYASMRGHDSIAIYRIDKESGRLTLVDRPSSGGEHPRHFTIDPSGQYLLVGNMVRMFLVTCENTFNN
ncbi:hypothetical protein EC973_004663 [Apophysomyces ossiformis]|uniref:6-phosphogluconolactonase n=1 Tax=Apophysomyces ossiformis TaxID=679940 RepID=A0A8H7BPY0_9FUNG|nr:hypothetical protein EC973_004663 [Apophysomyces ossiformis]